MDKKSKAIEIIRGIYNVNIDKLFWISDATPPKNIPKSFYFNIDNVSPTKI